MALRGIDVHMKPVHGIPTNVAAKIGRIIVLWSQLEATLRTILTNASGTNIKVARVIFRDPKVEDFVNVLRDLLMAENYILSNLDLSAIAKQLRDTKERRDILAHSLWGYSDGTLGVQHTRGTLDLNNLGRNPPRVARKVHPTFLPIDSTYLIETRKMILACMKSIRLLHAQVAAIRAALQQRRLALLVQESPPGPADKKPRSRRRSSQE